MQVNPLATPATAGLISQSGGLLLPELLKLTAISPQTRALREQREEGDEQRRRAREAPHTVAIDATTHGLAPGTPDAQRQALAADQAAHREMQAAVERKASQQRQSFQRSLADATARNQSQANGQKPGGSGAASGTKATDPPPATEPSAEDAPDNPSTPGTSAAAPKPTLPAEALRPSSAPAPVAPVTVTPDNTSTGSAPASEADSASDASGVEALSRVRTAASPNGTSAPTSPRAPAGAATSQATGGAATDARAPTTKPQATTARTSRPEPGESGKNDPNVERILRVLRSQITQDRARATLRLDPPQLGSVRLHLDLRRDVLTLQIDTQTTLAHRLLSGEIESLRQALETSGIQLERVEIRPPVEAAQPDGAGLPHQPEAESSGWDQATDAGAEHLPRSGTESSGAPLDDSPARDSSWEPAAESLVNILA